MSEYRSLKGTKVKFYTDDFTASNAREGELFFSDDDKEMKIVNQVESWASGGNLNVARRDIAGFGIQTAAVAAGGRTGNSSPFSQSAKSEEYNGSAWANGEDTKTTAGTRGACGTLTTGLVFGGEGPGNDESEEYNGTSYTEGNDLNVGRYGIAGSGTQGAALGAGGHTPGDSVGRDNAVEEYNGTSWTNVTDMPAARYECRLAGLQTAALLTGGGNAGGTANLATSLEYDGTNWTSGGNMAVATASHGTAGTQTDSLIFGGSTTTRVVKTYNYDGTTFAVTSDMATARMAMSDVSEGSTSGLALAGGGYTGTASLATTEEFTRSAVLKTVTDTDISI